LNIAAPSIEVISEKFQNSHPSEIPTYYTRYIILIIVSIHFIIIIIYYYHFIIIILLLFYIITQGCSRLEVNIKQRCNLNATSTLHHGNPVPPVVKTAMALATILKKKQIYMNHARDGMSHSCQSAEQGWNEQGGERWKTWHVKPEAHHH
jgi:hypothetical protein